MYEGARFLAILHPPPGSEREASPLEGGGVGGGGKKTDKLIKLEPKY